MNDITSFCSNSYIKPILTKVLVHQKDGKKYAVATDSFRLVEWQITDNFLFESIKCGYYNIIEWKTMCKAYNKKKKDLETFYSVLKNKPEVLDTTDYPDYKKIIPKKEELKNFDQSVKINYKFLHEMLKFAANKHDCVLFSDINQTEKVIYYKTYDMQIIIAKME